MDILEAIRKGVALSDIVYGMAGYKLDDEAALEQVVAAALNPVISAIKSGKLSVDEAAALITRILCCGVVPCSEAVSPVTSTCILIGKTVVKSALESAASGDMGANALAWTIIEFAAISGVDTEIHPIVVLRAALAAAALAADKTGDARTLAASLCDALMSLGVVKYSECKEVEDRLASVINENVPA